MYYGLLGTLFLLYVIWMLKSWRDSLEERTSEQPVRYTRFGDWANRVLMR
jgi:hypothetical protein